MRVGINGMGRIGRAFLRVAEETDGLEVVAVNDVADPEYDRPPAAARQHVRPLPRDIAVDGVRSSSRAQGRHHAEARPRRRCRGPSTTSRSWSSATGRFRTRDALAAHLTPAPSEVVAVRAREGRGRDVRHGRQRRTYDPRGTGSSRTRPAPRTASRPMVLVLQEAFGVGTAS